MANMIQTYIITNYGKTSVNVRNIELEPFGETTGQSIVLTEHLVQDKILVPNIARGDIVEVDMNKKQIIKKLFPAGTYDYMVVTDITPHTIWAFGPKYGRQPISSNDDWRVTNLKQGQEILVQENNGVYRAKYDLTVAAMCRRQIEKYAGKVY